MSDSFEEWKATQKDKYLYVDYDSIDDWLEAAYNAGRTDGIDSVHSLPHRAIFDSGVASWINEGLERAAVIADQHNLVCDGGEDDGTILAFGATIGDAIREEMK